jgi:anti-sigma B factor antagonist
MMDQGVPFELAAIPPPRLEALPESGLGVHIIRSSVDHVSYEPGRAGAPNVLSLTKHVGNLTREDVGGETVLRIHGVLDAVTAPPLRPAIDAVVEERRRSVTVDLAALHHIDSSGVGVVVSLYKRCREFGGSVRVSGLTGQPLSIFRLLRLDRVFDLG